jgi:hypothetical protein
MIMTRTLRLVALCHCSNITGPPTCTNSSTCLSCVQSDSGLEAPAAAPHQEASASSEDAPPSSQPQQKQGVNPVTQRLPGAEWHS